MQASRTYLDMTELPAITRMREADGNDIRLIETALLIKQVKLTRAGCARNVASSCRILHFVKENVAGVVRGDRHHCG